MVWVVWSRFAGAVLGRQGVPMSLIGAGFVRPAGRVKGRGALAEQSREVKGAVIVSRVIG